MPRAKKAPTSASARDDPLKRTSGNASKKAKPATEKPIGKTNPEKPPAKDCQAGNYLLLVHLCDTYEPGISRLLSIPPETTFDKLHEALQIAFGWANSHMHQFALAEESEIDPMMVGKTVLYLQTNAEDSALSGLDVEVKEEAKYSLADILDKAEYKGRTRLTYEYDMGDSWEHQICVLGRADDHLGKTLGVNEFNQKLICVTGEGHACAEDCGGPPGWEDLKDTFKKTRGGDKYRKDWYKNVCLSGDKKGLDPYKWDILDVNARLADVSTCTRIVAL